MHKTKSSSAALMKPSSAIGGEPLLSLGPLYRTFVRQVRVSARAHTLPVLDPESRTATQDLSELGFAATSSWGSSGRYHGRDLGNLIIHWPSVFRWDSSFTLESLMRRGFSAFVVLLLQFEEIFRRRSPLMWELLRRKVVDLFKQIEGVDPLPGHTPLSQEENSVLRMMFHELSTGQSPLLPALATTFRETFKQFQVTDISKTVRRLKKTYLQGFMGQLSLVSLMQTSPIFFADTTVAGEKKPVIAGIDPKKFTAFKLPAYIYEILIAYDLAVHGASSACGAQVFQSTGTPYLLVINFKRFISYRRNMGAAANFDKFKDGGMDDLRLAQKVLDVYQDHIVKYPKLRALSLEDMCRAQFFGFERAWQDVDWTAALVVNASELPPVLSNLRSLEEGRTGVALRYERKAPKIRKTRILDSVFQGTYGHKIQFTLIRHRGEVVFSPSFEMPQHLIWDETRMYRGQVRRKMRDGVHFRRELSKFFFTAAALMYDPSLSFCKIAGFEEWVSTTSKLPPTQFAVLARAQTGASGDQATRVAAANPRGLEFLPSEDEVIKAKYRRDMTEEDWSDILAQSPGRSRLSLTRRARVLALTMIKEGEYDLEKLPVRRRSGEIFEAIRRARAGDSGGEDESSRQ